MDNESAKTDVKITVTLPKMLLTRLDEHIAPRRRGRFIVEAIEERLAMEEQLAALDETAGVWLDENHPNMRTDEDIDRWLTGLRGSWGQAGESQRG